jgi:hypothetical protein
MMVNWGLKNYFSAANKLKMTVWITSGSIRAAIYNVDLADNAANNGDIFRLTRQYWWWKFDANYKLLTDLI